MQDKNSMLEELRNLEKTSNGSIGISFVRNIIRCLDNGDFHTAQVIFVNEGDKAHQFPKIKKCLIDLLGCRMHSVLKCENKFCLKSYSDLEKELKS